MISKYLSYFLFFPDKFCIFASMETKNKNLSDDKDIIRGLLNRVKNVEEMFYEYCETIIWSIIKKYYEKRRNKDSLFYELAHEFYIYIIKNPEILQDFKGTCKLKGYLTSVAFHYFSSYKFDLDPAIEEANKERRKMEGKQERMIRKIDNESANFHVYKPTPIPTEFRDEDSADAFLTFIVDDDNDVIVDIDTIINTSEVVYTNKCQLVRQTLAQMPPKQALVLKMEYFDNYSNERIAKELHITKQVLYNLRSKAKKSFITCFMNLIKQQNEEN